MKRGGKIASLMTCVADEYVEIRRNEIQLLKVGALQKGMHRWRAAFPLSVEKDYEPIIKEEENPFEDSVEDDASSGVRR